MLRVGIRLVHGGCVGLGVAEGGQGMQKKLPGSQRTGARMKATRCMRPSVAKPMALSVPPSGMFVEIVCPFISSGFIALLVILHASKWQGRGVRRGP